MSLIVSDKGSGTEFAIHPAGATAARCTRIIDLGTVDSEFEGKKKKKHEVAFCFESAELMGDDQGEYAGKPFLIIQRYTAHLGEKANMRKALQSWRGRPFTPAELDAFNLKAVLGKPCMVNMIHTEPNAQKKVYANIASIMPLPKGMSAPEAVGELIFFSLPSPDDENPEPFDQKAYDSLSDYFKGVIAKSDEYKALFGAGASPASTTKPASKAAVDDMDDDIPF